jgi:hypothetical protein
MIWRAYACRPHHSSPSRYVNSSAHFAGTDGVAPQGKASTPIDDRVLFDQLVQVLVFGCVYEPIPSRRCRRRRRAEWIDLGVMAAMEQLVLHVHHLLIGLELGDIAVDGCITKALRGAELAWPSPGGPGQAGHQTLVRGVHRGTHDITRDAKWSQPVRFQAPGGAAL